MDVDIVKVDWSLVDQMDCNLHSQHVGIKGGHVVIFIGLCVKDLQMATIAQMMTRTIMTMTKMGMMMR